MRARQLALRPMPSRVFWGLVAVIFAVCIVVGVAMRASLTDYANKGDEVGRLGFKLSGSSVGLIKPYTRDEADEVSRELGWTGDGSAPVKSMEELETESPVVVVGTFTGRRSYANRAFVCDVEVSRVVRGEGVVAGDTIRVLDPFLIQEAGDFPTEGAWFGKERAVQVNGDSPVAGMTPMRAGQEYLFFLEPKSYPEQWAVPAPERAYLLASSAYARVATDMPRDRVLVVDVDSLPQVGYDTDGDGTDDGWVLVMPELTVDEASDYDMCVWEDDVADLYVETCEGLLARVLGDGPAG